MSQFSSNYSIEVVDRFGGLLVDLSGRARNRQIVQSRNEAESIIWSIDLNEFENYCAALGVDPTTVFVTNQSEVRVKRLGSYLCGGQLIYAKPVIRPNEQVIELRATGFLNLFADRYTGTTTAGTVQETFTAVEATTIASELIEQSQALVNGDYGVTVGLLATVGPHDRTYSRTNIKDALQALTRVQTAPFDFQFTYDKVFNTYESLGSERPDVVFEYPNNIINLDLPNDGTGVANQIYALGQGFGVEAQTGVEVNDAGSQLTYRLKQKLLFTNGTDNSDNGITDAANSELAARAFPYELPGIMVDGNKAPYVTDYGIGDRVRVRVNSYKTLQHVNNLYRVEKRIITIDDNDNERIELILST